MSIQIDFHGVWDIATKARIEQAIRDCVGDSPGGETWNVSLSRALGYTDVLVKTLQQTRRRMFFVDVSELPEAIPVWLQQYPLQ